MLHALLLPLVLSSPTAAGSGTALPALRVLVDAYRARTPGFQLTVAESIGSAGAPLAVRDGAATLGLMSRPLKESETPGLCSVAFARDLLVLAAARDVPVRNVASADLVKIFSGTLRSLPGGPAREVHVLQREAGDSGSELFAEHVPGLKQALEDSLAARRWLVLFHDAEMQAALLQTPGAIGFFDLGALQSQKLPLQTLSIDGVAPSAEALAAGRYPFVKTLWFVVRRGAPAGDELGSFLGFARSAAGVATLEKAGYLAPLPGAAPCL